MNKCRSCLRRPVRTCTTRTIHIRRKSHVSAGRQGLGSRDSIPETKRQKTTGPLQETGPRDRLTAATCPGLRLLIR